MRDAEIRREICAHRRGEPGYALHLDLDRDGVASEQFNKEVGNKMRVAALLVGIAISIAGCTTSSPVQKDPHGESTLNLCRILTVSTDQDYRNQVARLLVKRGASLEKCQKLIDADRKLATAIAVTGVAVAAGVAASEYGGSGGYYPSTGAYGVAWDQFYDQYYNLVWRCRDKATGQFTYDAACSGKSMVDTTWPGWTA